MPPSVAVVRRPTKAPLALFPLTVLAAALASPDRVFADTRITDDYIAIVVEAEDSDSRDERWVLTLPDTPTTEDDPDGNHSDQAVGGAYIELLPDTRVTHDDELIQGENYWGFPGSGPEGAWTMTFPEAGRYHVHLRAYSTGTEDNGIHVGLNGNWPMNGRALQFCSAGQGWSWSSRQRESGGSACGVEKTIWVDVPSAGEHSFRVHAREDGFEIDRLMLIKDVSGNTRVCSPSGADDIDCRNGSIDSPDEIVDLTVRFDAPDEAVAVGDIVPVIAFVSNLDLFDTAEASTLSIDLALGDEWELVSADESCADDGETIDCALDDVEASEDRELAFELRALKGGVFELEGSVGTTSEEGVAGNDTARASIEVIEAVIPAEIALSLGGVDTLEVGSVGLLTVRASNTGQGDATAGQLSVSVPAALALQSLPTECSDTGSGATCTLGDLESGYDRSLLLTVRAIAAGAATVSAVLSADNVLENDIVASRVLTVDEPVVPDTDGGDDGVTDGGEGGTTGGETGGDAGGDADDEPSSKSGGGGSGAAGGWLALGLALVALRRRVRAGA